MKTVNMILKNSVRNMFNLCLKQRICLSVILMLLMIFIGIHILSVSVSPSHTIRTDKNKQVDSHIVSSIDDMLRRQRRTKDSVSRLVGKLKDHHRSFNSSQRKYRIPFQRKHNVHLLMNSTEISKFKDHQVKATHASTHIPETNTSTTTITPKKQHVVSDSDPIEMKYGQIWKESSCYVIEYSRKEMLHFTNHTTKNVLKKIERIHDPPVKFGNVHLFQTTQLPANIAYTGSKALYEDDVYLRPARTICTTRKDEYYTFTLLTTLLLQREKEALIISVLKNWSLFIPFLKPVLYVTPTEGQKDATYFIKKACDFGWDVYVAPECNSDGFPVLRSMMVDARNRYKSRYLGFSNADILYDHSLVDVIQYLTKQSTSIARNVYKARRFLMLGQPQQIQIQHGAELYELIDVYKLAQFTDLNPSARIDYFIGQRDKFPWSNIPPFVVSKPVFDNYLAWYFHRIDVKTCVLDTTTSITALHIAEQWKAYGWKSRKAEGDTDYNSKIARMHNQFVPLYGTVSCMRYKIIRSLGGKLCAVRAYNIYHVQAMHGCEIEDYKAIDKKCKDEIVVEILEEKNREIHLENGRPQHTTHKTMNKVRRLSLSTTTSSPSLNSTDSLREYIVDDKDGSNL